MTCHTLSTKYDVIETWVVTWSCYRDVIMDINVYHVYNVQSAWNDVSFILQELWRHWNIDYDVGIISDVQWSRRRLWHSSPLSAVTSYGVMKWGSRSRRRVSKGSSYCQDWFSQKQNCRFKKMSKFQDCTTLHPIYESTNFIMMNINQADLNSTEERSDWWKALI